MKKIFYLILVLSVVFTACEPLEDINAEIDAQGSQVIVGDAEYTLIDDDYDTLGLSYGSFNSEADAKSDIPALLSDMFPHWGKNSSVLVGYLLYVGNAPGVSNYTYADTFTFANQDYPGYVNNAFALYPDEDPSDALVAKFTNAQEGDVVLAKYKQFIFEYFFIIILLHIFYQDAFFNILKH